MPKKTGCGRSMVRHAATMKLFIFFMKCKFGKKHQFCIYCSTIDCEERKLQQVNSMMMKLSGFKGALLRKEMFFFTVVEDFDC